MKKNLECQVLCGGKEKKVFKPEESKNVATKIKEGYNVHL